MQQLTKEAEHVLMNGRSETWIEQKAVAVWAGLIAAVRRLYQDGDWAVLELITHLGNRLAVSSAAVVHTLTWHAITHLLTLFIIIIIVIIIIKQLDKCNCCMTNYDTRLWLVKMRSCAVRQNSVSNDATPKPRPPVRHCQNYHAEIQSNIAVSYTHLTLPTKRIV